MVDGGEYWGDNKGVNNIVEKAYSWTGRILLLAPFGFKFTCKSLD